MLGPGLVNWVRDWSAPLEIRCGGFDPPPFPPFDVSLYPFTTLTKLDYPGYPNYRDKRLESNLSLAPEGWYIGYEDGEFVRANVFTRGRKLRWELTLEVLCATHADTFVEFALEPRPVASAYTGPDRMRCLSGALGATWAGLRTASAWFEVEALGARSFVTRGELAIDGLAPRSFSTRLSNSLYDANKDDARWQLRWRIDRLANLDVYDGAFQVNDGQNGHATEREMVVRHATFRAL